MTTKHTPGPWEVRMRDVVYAGERLIADCENTPYHARPKPLHPTDEANARRIVACVNACEGISDDELNESDLAGQLELLETTRKQRDTIRAHATDVENRLKAMKGQRDELLALLVRFTQERDLETSFIWDEVHTAIAKHKGGA